MGAKPNKLRVVSLNYSGIFVSPFQFYAIDNWQELQKIGLIFENYMRKQHQSLLILSGSQKKPYKQYKRKQFSWKMQALDKEIKYGRYCPLYLKQQGKLESQVNLYKQINFYPGIRVNSQLKQIKGFFNSQSLQFDNLQTYNLFIQSKRSSFANEQQFQQWLENKLRIFQDQDQYSESWRIVWDRLLLIQQKKNIRFFPKKQQVSMCTKFDFFCYRAIIEYLFNVKENKIMLFQDERNFNELNYYEFDKIIQKLKKQQKIGQFINVYVSFLNKYFQIIDLSKKVKKTVEILDKQQQVDIINFQEANIKLKQQFKKINKFFTLGPANQNSLDQSLLIFKKSLPFIPPFYKQNFEREQEEVHNLKEKIKLALNSFNASDENMEKLIKTLFQILNSHFNYKTCQKIQQNINKYFNSYKQNTEKQNIDKNKLYSSFSTNVTKNIYLYLGNPMKFQMDQMLSKYKDKYIEYWNKNIQNYKTQKKQKLAQEAIGFLKEIEDQGLLCWSQALTLTNFTFTYKNLEIQKKPKIILGNFHLTSKEIRNKMQRHILGILVYQLFEIYGYKFIFSGDFNSYLTLKQKQNRNGLFTFLFAFKSDQKKNKQKMDDAQIEEDIKKIRNKITSHLSIFPKHDKIFTTKKKRTILQVQTHKTNELKEVCIDQIFSTFEILNEQSYVGDINYLGNRQNKNKQFLPHKEHPYDHYAVEIQIKLDQNRQANDFK